MWVSIHNTGLAVQGSSSRCLSRFASRFAWTRGSSARLLGLSAEGLGYIWFFYKLVFTDTRDTARAGAHRAPRSLCRLRSGCVCEPLRLSRECDDTHTQESHMWLRDTYFYACFTVFTLFTSHPNPRPRRGRGRARGAGAAPPHSSPII